MDTSENQMQKNSEQKSVNRLSRDGFAALAIGVIAAVLVFVMINHFVS
jgi:CHASE3 domain sensor protein